MAPRQPWTFREAVAFVAFAIVAIGYSWWRHYWFVRHGEGVWRLGLPLPRYGPSERERLRGQ